MLTASAIGPETLATNEQGEVMTYDQETVERWFSRLEELLVDRKLPCENGPARLAKANEFMLMDFTPDSAAFKHRDTRNYVHVRKIVNRPFTHARKGEWELVIPCTDDAFNVGFFDKF